jgi:hypothetical protein
MGRLAAISTPASTLAANASNWPYPAMHSAAA